MSQIVAHWLNFFERPTDMALLVSVFFSFALQSPLYSAALFVVFLLFFVTHSIRSSFYLVLHVWEPYNCTMLVFERSIQSSSGISIHSTPFRLPRSTGFFTAHNEDELAQSSGSRVAASAAAFGPHSTCCTGPADAGAAFLPSDEEIALEDADAPMDACDLESPGAKNRWMPNFFWNDDETKKKESSKPKK
jgi:hypothetical protein